MYLKNTNQAVDWKYNAIGAGANDGKPYKRLLHVKLKVTGFLDSESAMFKHMDSTFKLLRFEPDFMPFKQLTYIPCAKEFYICKI